MTDQGNLTRLTHWIVCHPRSGWYIGAWALLVTSNALFGWLDRRMHFMA